MAITGLHSEAFVKRATVQLIPRLAEHLSHMRPILDGAGERVSTGRHVPARPYVWRLLRESRRRATARAHEAALRATLQDYGSLLSASGVALERLVPCVRAAMQRAVVGTDLGDEQSTRVVELGVLWGIEGYYRERGAGVSAPGRAVSRSFDDVPLRGV